MNGLEKSKLIRVHISPFVSSRRKWGVAEATLHTRKHSSLD